jgi:hypothetical protein
VGVLVGGDHCLLLLVDADGHVVVSQEAVQPVKLHLELVLALGQDAHVVGVCGADNAGAADGVDVPVTVVFVPPSQQRFQEQDPQDR